MVKKEFPDEEEIVFCTVDKILGTSIFVKLDDYEDKEAVIHISEIAPGRIRNIRDYVVPNKKIACKVLAVDAASGKIDLSLRRVTAKEKKDLFEEHKKEKDSAAVLKIWAEQAQLNFQEITEKILAKFEKLSLFLQDIKEDPEKLKQLSINKKQEEILLQLIKERVKSKKIELKKKISLSSKAENGIVLIKNLLKLTKPAKVTYLSSPFYLLEIEAGDYKEANRLLEEKIKILK